MATPIAELFVSVGADVSEAILGLNTLAGALNNTKSGFEGATPAAEALVGLGAGIAAGLGAAAVSAAEFNNKLVETQNNTTLTDDQMQQMRDTILRLGSEAPVALDQLADGYRHIANFGFDAAATTQILDAAMKSAVSTGGNTAATAETLAAVMKEFSISGSQAAQTMDEIHTAAAEGNVTLEEFTNTFGQVAAFGSSLGVPLDQLLAAFSALTRHGFDAATAATQVKDELVHIVNPSQEATKALNDLSNRSGVNLAKAFSATGLHALGLEGVIAKVQGAMQKLGLSQDEQTALWLRLIPNIRGGAAAFVLAGNGADDFHQILKDLHEQLGITDEAFDRIKGQASFQFGLLGAQFTLVAISLGQFLLPALTGVTTGITELIKNFGALPDSVKQGVVNVLALTSGISLLVGGFVLLAPVMGAIVTGAGALAGAVLAMAPAIAVGVGLILVLRQAWERDVAGIQEAANNFSNIGDIIQAALAGNVGDAFDGLVEDFKRLSPEARKFIDSVQAQFKGLQSFLGPILGNIGLVLDKAFSGNFAGAFDTLQAIITAISPQVGQLIQNFREFATQLGPVLQSAFSEGKVLIDQFLERAREVATYLSTTFGPLLEAVGNFVAQNIGPAFQVVAGAVGLLKDTLGGVVTNGLRPLKEIVDAFQANPDALPGFFNTLGDSLATFGGKIQTVMPVLGSLASLFGAVNSLIGTLANVGFQALIGLFENALIPAFQKFAPVLVVLGAPLALVMAPIITFFQFISDHAADIAKGIDDITGAVQRLANAINQLPSQLPNIPGLGATPDFLKGGPVDLGAIGNNARNAIGGAINQATGGQIIINNNGVTINNAGDLETFSQSMANAIAAASRRVGPPVSNGGFPAIEGQFT